MLMVCIQVIGCRPSGRFSSHSLQHRIWEERYSHGTASFNAGLRLSPQASLTTWWSFPV